MYLLSEDCPLASHNHSFWLRDKMNFLMGKILSNRTWGWWSDTPRERDRVTRAECALCVDSWGICHVFQLRKENLEEEA